MAFSFFAGGWPYDIMLVHGVSLVSVYANVWGVIDAICKNEDLKYCFPNHEQAETDFCWFSQA
jgi:hypothetical protein